MLFQKYRWILWGQWFVMQALLSYSFCVFSLGQIEVELLQTIWNSISDLAEFPDCPQSFKKASIKGLKCWSTFSPCIHGTFSVMLLPWWTPRAITNELWLRGPPNYIYCQLALRRASSHGTCWIPVGEIKFVCTNLARLLVYRREL